MSEQPNTLWTRDFTIITLGSMVSMFGNSMAGFAVSLFVLDYTMSPFFYAIYTFLYTLPQVAAPILAGPLIDRFSRRKTIYMLDFLSSAIYLSMGAAIYSDMFSFPVLALMTFIIGTINSVYAVSFNSFYPLLITRGNFSKAYSIQSSIMTLSYVMLPVATFLYKTFGIYPLLFVNSLCFFTAAVFEVRISDVEKIFTNIKNYNMRNYVSDSREGFRYIKSEKGLQCITAYFVFSCLFSGVSQVIVLPWFRASFDNGEYVYMSVWGFMLIGRIIGDRLHYRFKMPPEKKFIMAFTVYICSAILDGFYLYTPFFCMRISCFLVGILSSTSYNIRISATQHYVPNDKKGRFNGAFMMMTTLGSLAGQFLGGAVSTVLPMRVTLSLFSLLAMAAALVFVWGGRNHIKPIYNQVT